MSGPAETLEAALEQVFTHVAEGDGVGAAEVLRSVVLAPMSVAELRRTSELHRRCLIAAEAQYAAMSTQLKGAGASRTASSRYRSMQAVEADE